MVVTRRTKAFIKRFIIEFKSPRLYWMGACYIGIIILIYQSVKEIKY